MTNALTRAEQGWLTPPEDRPKRRCPGCKGLCWDCIFNERREGDGGDEREE